MRRTEIPGTYEGLDAFLGDKRERELCNNTVAIRVGSAIHVRLYATDVVTVTWMGDYVVRAGTHLTPTTKQRINAVVSAAGWRVYSERGVWRVRNVHSGRDLEFTEGMVLLGIG